MTHDKDGLRVLENATPDGSGSVNRWSAVSGAEPEDARTLRNTMTSEYQLEMAKRVSAAGELEKDTAEGGESDSKEDDVVVDEVAEPAPLPSISAGLDDFPDGGWRAWLIVAGVSTDCRFLWIERLTCRLIAGRLQHYGDVSFDPFCAGTPRIMA